MGYSIVVCCYCNQPDTKANCFQYEDGELKNYEYHAKCRERQPRLDKTDEIKNIIDKAITKRYISQKTLPPSLLFIRDDVINFLQKHGYKKYNEKNITVLSIWNEFWKAIDYIVLHYNNTRRKKTITRKLNFINDLMY